jgi:hypothetical protein
MAGMSASVDVLAAMVSLASFGGTISPRKFLAKENVPRGTGLIANRARWLNGMHTRIPTTATVLRALYRAERDGVVACVGTGVEHSRAWNKNATDCKERYWVLTDAAIAAATGETK